MELTGPHQASPESSNARSGGEPIWVKVARAFFGGRSRRGFGWAEEHCQLHLTEAESKWLIEVAEHPEQASPKPDKFGGPAFESLKTCFQLETNCSYVTAVPWDPPDRFERRSRSTRVAHDRRDPCCESGSPQALGNIGGGHEPIVGTGEFACEEVY